MPLRRSLMTALCLVIFGTVPTVAQEKDPFAEWDRVNAQPSQKSRLAGQQKRPAVTEVASAVDTSMKDRPVAEKSADKASVTYFSAAQAATPTVEPAKPKTAAAIPMREKTQTRLAVERLRAEAQTTPAAQPVVTSSPVVPSAQRDAASIDNSKENAGKISTVAMFTEETEPPRSQGVRNAEFSDSGRPAAGNVIRSVADSSELAQGANSFEDFLGTSGPATSNQTPGFDFGNETEEEAAEPLFNRQNTASKSPAANRSVEPSRSSSTNTADYGATTPGMLGASNGPQSPGVTLQWVNHGGFNVGQMCDVELVVKNTSQTVVRSVMTEAVIPENVEVIEARPASAEGAEMPTWTFGELQPGQSRSVMLKVIPKTRGAVRLDAYVRLTGTSSSQFSVQEPMIGVAVSGPEEIEVGQQVGYIVRVSNPGTGLANNVVIQAAIPEGLEHRNGSLLTIEIGTLNPGESRQARLSLTAVEGGDQQLAVRVLADGGLSDQTTTAISVAEPQLAVALVGPEAPMAGRSEDYKLSVSNSGGVQSTNVRAKYIIPDGCTFVSADRGGKFVEVDNAVEWFVGTLQPNDSSNFTVTLKASESGEVVHKAGVISERGQVTTCVLASDVIGTAILNMKIAADHRELRVDQEIRWEVTVRNSGTREATNVGVSCELPAGFEFIDAEGPTKYIAENGVLIFRSIGSIDAETDVKIVIHGRCTREGSQRLRLRVASESITDALIGEESASVTR